MDSVQDMSNDNGFVEEQMGSSGETPDELMVDTSDTDPNQPDHSREDLPKGIKERLGRQEKRHQREMRQMQDQLEALRAYQSQAPQMQEDNSYSDGGVPSGIDEQIHKAVSYALRHKEMEERKAQEYADRVRVAKKYQEFDQHLDNFSDKYDDFEDVVRARDVPFTPTMRDVAARILPKEGPGSAGEVLYKLGKNRDLLLDIAKSSPDDQASEMVKLSHALVNGNDSKQSPSRPLGNIKSNPVTNTVGITDKTSVSDLRKRMRNGWK